MDRRGPDGTPGARPETADGAPGGESRRAPPGRKRAGRPFHALRRAAGSLCGLPVAALLVLSLALNGFLAFSDAVHTAVAGAASAVGLVTVLAAERTASRKLRDANARLTESVARTSARLAAERGALRKAGAELGVARRERDALRRRVRDTARRVNARLLKTATWMAAAAPAKAIPYGGAVVIASATALEIREICQTVRDMERLAAAPVPEGDPDLGEPTVCGIEVPDGGQLLEAARSAPEKAWNRAREALGGLGSVESAGGLAMEFPDIPPDILERWRELAERPERWWGLWRRGGE